MLDDQPLLSEEQIKEILYPDDNDPRSPYYKRTLCYPKMNWGMLILNWVVFLALIGASYAISYFISESVLLSVLISLGIGLAYILIRIKAILITLTEFYQLLAPRSVRERCCYEPSCSQYMILSLRKYGAIKGLNKGIKRLCRCHAPNGGYDEP